MASDAADISNDNAKVADTAMLVDPVPQLQGVSHSAEAEEREEAEAYVAAQMLLEEGPPAAASSAPRNGQQAYEDIIQFMIKATAEANPDDCLTDADVPMDLATTDGWVCDYAPFMPQVINNAPAAARVQAESEFAAAIAELPDLSGDLESL